MPPTSRAIANDVAAATLSRRAQREISQIMQDIRVTLKRLTNLECSSLAVMDGDSVDAIKDLYYVISNEDPMNVQPARKLLHQQHVVRSSLLPILSMVNADVQGAQENQKRWSVCLYHTFRAISAMMTPIVPDNDLLKPGCALDDLLFQTRVDLVRAPNALCAIVQLLQYYVERKAEKMARFAPAEESKIEDARMENILTFFRNILSPPRATPGQESHINTRDAQLHLAIVGVLHDSDLYATMSVLFGDRSEARGHLTRLVFVVADVYRHTFRLATPKEVAVYALHTPTGVPGMKVEKVEATAVEKNKEPNSEDEAPAVPDKPTKPPLENPEDVITAQEPKKKSVFDFLNDPSDDNDEEDELAKALKEEETKLKAENESQRRASRATDRLNRRSATLRDAMQRERAFIGGAAAVTTSARWTNKYSGGFTVVKKEAPAADKGDNDVSGVISIPASTKERKAQSFSKAVVDARKAVDKRRTGPLKDMRANFQLNSDILCTSAGKKARIAVDSRIKQNTREVRTDLVKNGKYALAQVLGEFIEEKAFGIFTTELRARITDLLTKRTAAESEDLPFARRAFLSIVSVAVGFHREKIVIRHQHKEKSKRNPKISLTNGSVTKAVATDICALGSAWCIIETGIELESFQLVFDSLRSISGSGKQGAEDVMLATSALKQMMKTMQCLVVHPENISDIDREWDELPLEIRATQRKRKETGREFALNTLEDLFEREDYLNSPCLLAKEFDVKWHTFGHLANIVEVAYCFTSTLRDEEELKNIKVRYKKRVVKRKKKTKKIEEEEEAEEKNEAEIIKGDDPIEKSMVGEGKSIDAFDEAVGNFDKTKDDDNANASGDMDNGNKSAEDEGNTSNKRDMNETGEDTENSNGQEKNVTPSKADLLRSDIRDNEENSDGVEKENANTAATLNKADLLRCDVIAHSQEEKNEANGTATENANATENGTSKAELLQADVNNFSQEQGETGAEKNTSDPEKQAVDDDDAKEVDADGEAEREAEMKERKVESIGVIRRFAHPRSLQILAMPIRASLCLASHLSGGLYAVPEGSRSIQSSAMAAKSVAILETIWNTSGGRDKGSLRGNFFTFSMLQMLHLAMNIRDTKKLGEANESSDSIVCRLGDFGMTVTRHLSDWIRINPILSLDIFLGMDKGTCNQYAHSLHLQNLVENADYLNDNKVIEDDEKVLDELMLRARNTVMYDSDESDGEGRRKRNERAKELRQERKEAKLLESDRKMQVARARRNRARQIRNHVEEDDDVDDLDALNIGIGNNNSDDDGNKEGDLKSQMLKADTADLFLNSRTPRAERLKKRKLSTPQEMDLDFDSETDEDDEDKKKPKRKKRKKKQRSARKAIQFESDDEDELDKIQVPKMSDGNGKKKKSKKKKEEAEMSEDEYNDEELARIEETVEKAKTRGVDALDDLMNDEDDEDGDDGKYLVGLSSAAKLSAALADDVDGGEDEKDEEEMKDVDGEGGEEKKVKDDEETERKRAAARRLILEMSDDDSE